MPTKGPPHKGSILSWSHWNLYMLTVHHLFNGKTGNHRPFQIRQFSYYALYKEIIFWPQPRVPPTKGQFYHDPIEIYICLPFIIFSMEKPEITGRPKQGNSLTTPCIKKSFFGANEGSPPQRVNSIMIPLKSIYAYRSSSFQWKNRKSPAIPNKAILLLRPV